MTALIHFSCRAIGYFDLVKKCFFHTHAHTLSTFLIFLIMEIKSDVVLFEWIKTNAWSGGKEAAHYFTIEEIDTLEVMLTDCTPEGGWTDIEINDMFWFDTETLCEWLNIDYEEWEKREKQW